MKHSGWYGWACLIALGCGDGSDEDEPNLSARTPAELCSDKCALPVAAGCSNVQPDFGASCNLICASKYDNFPSCDAQLRALDHCASARVTYGCTASGVITASPMGACAAEGARCVSCTGDFLNCL